MTENITFKDLKLIPELRKAVEKQGYKNPTPIQRMSIPGLLEKKDLIGIAQTGTGKTAAFTLPILQNMTDCDDYGKSKIKALILAPTRELASQIGESFTKYGKFLKFKHTVIFGGVNQGSQVKALVKGVDILVATPGRLIDLLNQRKLNLKDVEYFVLDEADRMLDMGFIPDIKRIIAKLPKERQSLFFSATMSKEVDALAKTLLTNPIKVEMPSKGIAVEKIDQQVFFVDQENKEKLLLGLLKSEDINSVLIFTRTKFKANKLAISLNKHHIIADAIHGNKSQGARTRAIKDFKKGKVKILVATDIAARGIDIDNISHVINYELPNESESYVHRIGRTARAGKDGIAISFCAAEEREYLRSIEKLTKQKIHVMEHAFHSETARRAVGKAAKPAPRGRRGKPPIHKRNTKTLKRDSGSRGNSKFGSRPRSGGSKSGRKVNSRTKSAGRSGGRTGHRTGSISKPRR